MALSMPDLEDSHGEIHPWDHDPRDVLARWWVLRIMRCVGAAAIFNHPRCRYSRYDMFRWLGLDVAPPPRRAEHFDHDDSGLVAEVDTAVAKLIQQQSGQPSWPEPLGSNLGALAKAMQLNESEQRVLAFLVLGASHPRMQTAIEVLPEHLDLPMLVALLTEILDLEVEETRGLVNGRSQLLGTGLVEIDRELPFPACLKVLPEAVFALTSRKDSVLELLGSLFPVAPAAKLATEDFDYLAEHEALLRSFIARARASGLKGVNVLVYGPAGTGKTEFIRTFAAAIGAVLFEVPGEVAGVSLKPDERLRRCQVGQRLLHAMPEALLLFDEIEDALAGQGSTFFPSEVSKHRVNRLLEENLVPTFWVCNHHAVVEPWQLRRFDYVMHVPIPPRSVRRRIAEQALDRLNLEEATLQLISDERRLCPALLEKAGRMRFDLGYGSADHEVLRFLGQYLTAAGQSNALKVPSMDGIPFSLEFMAADCDLDALVSGLSRSGTARICLHGPPGTGKTAFGRWLAKTLDRPLIAKRASDLLTPYVGETESRIRAMFDEAVQEEALLLIDEVDGLFLARGQSSYRWELTQTNEFLAGLESYVGLLVCTTNQLDRVDQAFMRRFDFKIGLSYLSEEQLAKLIESACPTIAASADLPCRTEQICDIRKATPGDVANVIRRLGVIGSARTAEAIKEALKQELTLKSGPANRIGFMAGLESRNDHQVWEGETGRQYLHRGNES